MHPAGLLAWFILNTFPSVLLAGQWFEVSVKVRVKLPLTNLTATGIAPDFHGIPFSPRRGGDQIRGKANLLSISREETYPTTVEKIKKPRLSGASQR